MPRSDVTLERSSIESHRSRSWGEVCGLGGRVEVEDASNGSPEAVDGALGGFAQMRLQLGEGLLDWIEV
ncbi:hypothetical protein [Sphingomonas xinjiangensis]|uniref:Uncharacterized protein n=1 Tax=Sphingomonas xinjiangensis TaxID=643568 RepID=A0A840YPF7_9SPHN|nr:hypothetical protein [Sphingomonas xinjiangensis]MBB5712180.1 hypothetical protein [Sphingomonas xinjiangensis]